MFCHAESIIGVGCHARNGHDWTEKYRPTLKAASALLCTEALLDGEMVVAEESGRTDFSSMRATITSNPSSLTFMAFDLLHLDGQDLRREALTDRRSRLQELIEQRRHRRADSV